MPCDKLITGYHGNVTFSVLQSSVRRYHTYFKETAVCIGDKEEDNNHDKYAIAVKTGDCGIFGHVPFELSELFYEFLKDNGEVFGGVTGSKVKKGMERAQRFLRITNLLVTMKVC